MEREHKEQAEKGPEEEAYDVMPYVYDGDSKMWSIWNLSTGAMLGSRNFTTIETTPYKDYIDIGMFELAATSRAIFGTSIPIDSAGGDLGV